MGSRKRGAMEGDSRLPEPGALAESLRWLDAQGFAATSALPLFAARHWSPGMERRARRRFLEGRDNVEEVAVPRWYWRRLAPTVAELFRALTLAQEESRGNGAPLAPLLRPDGSTRWRLVNRFARYVLHSRPEETGDALVYFGDDTLFLMQGARRLLAGGNGSRRVLDLCCGGGAVGLALPVFSGEVLGVDINPAALALARLAAAAQGLAHYQYLEGDAVTALEQRFDLVVGNPPTLPPELGGTATLYATGSAAGFLLLLDQLLSALTPQGQALLTVFSTADGRGAGASDPLRRELAALIGSGRGYSYTVRRQFALGDGRWLRHVALELLPQRETRGERFADPARGGLELPGLGWRRAYR